MTSSRRRSSAQSEPAGEKITEPVVKEPEVTESETQVAPTGKIFLGEEDKRLLQKFNKHIVNKLGLGGSRSFKI